MIAVRYEAVNKEDAGDQGNTAVFGKKEFGGQKREQAELRKIADPEFREVKRDSDPRQQERGKGPCQNLPPAAFDQQKPAGNRYGFFLVPSGVSSSGDGSCSRRA